MSPGYHGPHSVGYGTHHHSRLCRYGEAVYLVARVVDLSEQRVWYGDELVGSSVDVYSVGLVIHAHHFIIRAVYSDRLAARVAASGE